MFRCVQYWYNGCGGTMNMFSNQFKCIQTCSQSDPGIAAAAAAAVGSFKIIIQ